MSDNKSVTNNTVDSIWNLNNFDDGNVDALLLNSIKAMYQKVCPENDDEMGVFE